MKGDWERLVFGHVKQLYSDQASGYIKSELIQACASSPRDARLQSVLGLFDCDTGAGSRERLSLRPPPKPMCRVQGFISGSPRCAMGELKPPATGALGRPRPPASSIRWEPAAGSRRRCGRIMSSWGRSSRTARRGSAAGSWIFSMPD